MNRRSFVAALLASGLSLNAADGKQKKIILRSSWQTVNIGDIAHTPGVLHILETYLPNIEVMLWPGSVKDGVAEMLQERFPKLKILNKDRQSFSKAINEADLLSITI